MSSCVTYSELYNVCAFNRVLDALNGKIEGKCFKILENLKRQSNLWKCLQSDILKILPYKKGRQTSFSTNQIESSLLNVRIDACSDFYLNKL